MGVALRDSSTKGLVRPDAELQDDAKPFPGVETSGRKIQLLFPFDNPAGSNNLQLALVNMSRLGDRQACD